MSSDLPSDGRSSPPEPTEILIERGAPLLEALADHAPRLRESSQATATYAFVAAAGLGLGRRQCEAVRELARLLEVGSVYVPVAVLDKPAADRDPEEQRAFSAREVAGYGLLVGSGIPEEQAQQVLRARESYDGSGPEGMRRETIPLESRILRAAETCRAALETSPGLEGMQPHRRAIQVLAREAGTTLDPDVTAALVAALEGAASREAAAETET